MRLRPLTPRAICVPGRGLRTTATAAAIMSTKARVISSTSGPISAPRNEVAARDAFVELYEIGFHRGGLEGDRKRAPVQPVLLEIQQHQSARKQQPENSAPAVLGGEQLGGIEHHKLIGFGPEQHDAGLAKHMAAIDRAISC